MHSQASVYLKQIFFTYFIFYSSSFVANREISCIVSNIHSCGPCGICKRHYTSSQGSCNFSYLTKNHSLFYYDSGNNAGLSCMLRDYCKVDNNPCHQSINHHSTGKCFTLYGNYQCECFYGFFGRDCEYTFNYKLTLSNNLHLNSSVALMNNIAYTPIFNSSHYAVIYISLSHKGRNLEVHIDIEREKLIYSENRCERDPRIIEESILNFCRNIFKVNYNINICARMNDNSNNNDPARKQNCLIVLRVPYPNTNYENDLIYAVGANNTFASVVGKVETCSVTVYNRLSELNNKPVPITKHTFQMVNMYYPVDRASKCIPKIRLLNCGKSMNEMPKFTPFREIVLLSFVEIDFISNCHNLKQLKIVWKMWKVIENHDELRDQPAGWLFYKNHYYIKEYSLDYGVYKVKMTATGVFSNDQILANIYGYFYVAPISVQTMIVGGTSRSLGFKQILDFRILTLLIPDRHEDPKPPEISYSWQCDIDDISFCKTYETTNSCRTVSAGFPEGSRYLFKLTTKFNSKLKTNKVILKQAEFQNITIKNYTKPSISLQCLLNCGGSVFRSNPQEIIHLELSLNAFTGAQHDFVNTVEEEYHWQYQLLNSKASFQDASKIREENTFSNIFLIKKNMLEPDKEYEFLVTDTSSEFRFASLIVKTCSIPTNISCTIFPQSGIKGVTYFDVNCTCQFSEVDYYLSTTFEFYDRYFNENVGRHLGFSYTGNLLQVMLTRDTLFARAVNFYGAFSETVINVSLSSPPDENVLKPHLEYNNYIFTLPLISGYADMNARSSYSIFDMLIKKLLNVQIYDVAGVTIFQNTLYNVACYQSPDNSQCTLLESQTLLTLSKILHRISIKGIEFLVDPCKTSSYVTPTKVFDFLQTLFTCSSVVLHLCVQELDYINEEDRINLDTSTYLTTLTLNNIVTTMVHSLLASKKQIKLYSESIEMTVLQNTNSRTEPRRRDLHSGRPICKLVKLLKPPNNYIKKITFHENPYWWSRSYTVINTEVVSIQVKYPNFEVKERVSINNEKFVLKVGSFEPTKVNGSVKQPDPTNGPQINDLLVSVYRIMPDPYSVSFITFTGMNNDTTLRVVTLQDLRPDYDFMKNSSKVITKESPELQFKTDAATKDTFVYIGILPGEEINVNITVNYTFQLYSISCEIWRFDTWINGNMCKVSKYSDNSHLVCSCNMSLELIVGGSMQTPPTEFNPFSDIQLMIEITDNLFTIILVMIIPLQYIVLLIWTRNMDKTDKHRLNIEILEDNVPTDKYGYLIAVFTGLRVRAGTTSNVGIRLLGDRGISRSHILYSSRRKTLRANSDDWFLLFTPHHLGILTKIQLWIDYTGERPHWYCSKVFVCDLTKYETDFFFIEKWFGVSLSDVFVTVIKSCATYNETNSFIRIFSENLVHGVREIHIFTSIFFKHPRSFITRTDHLTIAICGLYIIMAISSLLYYSSTPFTEDLAGFNVTREIYTIAIICSFISSLLCSVLMHLIQNSYKISPNPSIYHDHLESEDMFHLKRKTYKLLVNDPKWLGHLKKYILKCIKPHKLIPVKSIKKIQKNVEVDKKYTFYSLFLCAVSFSFSTYITTVTCLHFKKHKTIHWLLCVLMSAMLNNVIILPVKIIVLGLLLCVCNTRLLQMMSHRVADERIPKDQDSEAHLEIEEDRLRRDIYQPPTNFALVYYKVRQENLIKFWKLTYTIISLFSLVLIGWFIHEFDLYGLYETNKSTYRSLESPELYETVHRETNDIMSHFFNNFESQFFLSMVYCHKNITLSDKRSVDTGRTWRIRYSTTSCLLGIPHLRQIRVRSGLCHTPAVMSKISGKCIGKLSDDTEDREDYNIGWTKEDLSDSDLLFNKSSWVYVDSSVIGYTDVNTPSGFHCHGGGYIADLGSTLEDSKYIIRSHINRNWIDPHTKILIAEFTLYNDNYDIYSIVSIVSETQYNNIKSGVYVKSTKLRNIHTIDIILFCWVLLYTAKILIQVNEEGVKHFFTKLWNIHEAMFLFFFILTIIYYITYILEMNKCKEEVLQQGKEFLCLSGVINNFYETRNVIGILFFLAAFKLVRIIQFSDEVRWYIKDLYNARYNMLWTWIGLSLAVFVQVRLIMYSISAPLFKYSLNDILAFQTDFKKIIESQKGTESKIMAFTVSATTAVGGFSFLVSLHHCFTNRDRIPEKKATFVRHVSIARVVRVRCSEPEKIPTLKY